MLVPASTSFTLTIIASSLLLATPVIATHNINTSTGDWFDVERVLRGHGVYVSGGGIQLLHCLTASDSDRRWASGGKLGGEHPTDLCLCFSQQCGDSLAVLLGKIRMLDFASGREFSGSRSIEQFQHIEFVTPLSGICSPMIFGSIISLNFERAWYSLMIYDPQNLTLKTGLEHPFPQGEALNGAVELPSQFFRKRGKHVFSAAYSTKNGLDYRNISEPQLPDAPAYTARREEGHHWYDSYAFEQTLWCDVDNSQVRLGSVLPGWGVACEPELASGSELGVIGGSSPLAGSEHEKFGLGAFYLNYSDALKERLLPVLPARAQSGLKVFYNFSATH